jgi:hypothetical protein
VRTFSDQGQSLFLCNILDSGQEVEKGCPSIMEIPSSVRGKGLVSAGLVAALLFVSLGILGYFNPSFFLPYDEEYEWELYSNEVSFSVTRRFLCSVCLKVLHHIHEVVHFSASEKHVP